MKQLTLCFCIQDERVLLAMKRDRVGFGSNKWNGYGGKIKDGETAKSATIRELKEESGLVADERDLRQVAFIHFSFAGQPTFKCAVFLVDKWRGKPLATEEIMKSEWYPISQLPFAEMWAADAKWLPLVLAGEKIEAQVNFNADGSVVEEFSYKNAEFD